ncbi:hypothetical protein HY745_07750 [Candidatus Desantisbacteria bacterium]|nr:hypothetical protein [Candidatus Desantisbacteria bacterium]
MGHKIVAAIIENGRLKQVDKRLLIGKRKVHLIYDDDVVEKSLTEKDIIKIVKETSGIYRGIDVKAEAKKLREEWERNAHD